MINDDFASILVLNKNATKSKQDKIINLQDANGNKMVCNGQIQLKFSHKNNTFDQNFTRVKNLSQKVILGLDFLVSNKAKIDFNEKQIYTQNLTIPLDITTKIPDSILFVSETIQIPQNNAKFIAVNHNKNDPMFKATREGLVTENQNLFTQNDIKIQPAVVSINEGNTFIFVQNKSSKPILIHKNTKIAKVHHLTKKNQIIHQ